MKVGVRQSALDNDNTFIGPDEPGLAVGKADVKSENSEYRGLEKTHPPQY